MNTRAKLFRTGAACPFAAAFLLTAGTLIGTARAAGVTYMVTTTADTGKGSLRQAIMNANGNPPPAGSLNQINFKIGNGVQVIAPQSPLPTISAPVIIDAFSPPAFPKQVIVLNGSGAGDGANGLNVAAGSCRIYNFVITNFTGDGILLRQNGGNVVQANYIGIGADGMTPGPNGGGVEVDNIPSNIIGGSYIRTNGFNPGNVISGNLGAGVFIHDSGAQGNRVIGNFIGTDKSGTIVDGTGNGADGVVIQNAAFNTVGGVSGGKDGPPTPGKLPGNVISGNQGNGVRILDAQSTSNFVVGNIIGTDGSVVGGLTGGRFNGLNGVSIEDSSQNTVGGPWPNLRNIISANRLHGVNIQLVNDDEMADENNVQGNYIGTDAAGKFGYGNGLDGVCIQGVFDINNVLIFETNTIETNGEFTNIITSYITQELVIAGSRSNLIGGDAIRPGTAPGNVIAYNGASGSAIQTPTGQCGVEMGPGCGQNYILGNIIGLGADGKTDLGNFGPGVFADSANFNDIANNVISANSGEGVKITGQSPTVNKMPVPLSADFNVITHNLIGVDITGFTSAKPKILANGNDGVLILNGSFNTVGGMSQSVSANVISGNGINGVRLSGDNARKNKVLANFIGTNPQKAKLPNSEDGVHLDDGAKNNKINQNKIAFNVKAGMDVIGGETAGNSTDPDSIFDNGTAGISLESHGNNRESAPNLISAEAVASGAILVRGTFSSPEGSFLGDADYPVDIDFFDNTAPDASGNYEGETYIGSMLLTAPGSFTVELPGASIVTATATDTNGNTSEFSLAVAVTPCDAAPDAAISVTFGEIALDPDSGLYDQEVTLENTGAHGAPAPISLVLDGLPGDVTLENADGATVCAAPLGSPYIDAEVPADGGLEPGGTVDVLLELSAPSAGAISYTPRVLNGAGER